MRRNLDDPGEAVDTFLISSVREMLASTFDSALPPVSIDDWLFVALAPKIDIPRQRSTSWTTTFCPDRQSAIPGPGAELCVEAGIPAAPDRTVHILFAVAKLVVTGSARAWRRTDASVRDIYVERFENESAVDSIDVPALHDLPDSVDLPASDWPAVDLETRITWTPDKPAPGEKVHVSVFVGNLGRRSLDRAAVSVLVSPCCANASEVRREWFPPIPAGKWVRLDLVVSLPNGAGMAAVSARPGPSIKAAHESQPQNNETIVLIGDPSRPR